MRERWRALLRWPLPWWGVVLVPLALVLLIWLTRPWGVALCMAWVVLSELWKSAPCNSREQLRQYRRLRRKARRGA